MCAHPDDDAFHFIVPHKVQGTIDVLKHFAFNIFDASANWLPFDIHSFQMDILERKLSHLYLNFTKIYPYGPNRQ